MIGRYLRGVLIGLDQFANSLLGGFPDETLSSRMGRRLKRKRRAIESEATCAVLDVLEDEHCAKAIEETPDGETDAHHLGHVIYELPLPVRSSTSAEVFYRPKRWRRLMVVAGALLLLAGCAGWPVVVVPYPAPSPSATPASVPTPIPDATPEPQPSATPAPTPAPPLPTPPPTPAPPTGPVCRDGCVSCAQFIAGELGSGALVRCEPGKAPSCRSGLAYNLVGGDINRPEFTDTASCLMTDASGNTRNRRHHNDGSVCEPGCVKATPPPPATPQPTPAPPPASPTPKPPRPTPPPGEEPPFTESGNFPLPDLGTCPAWFADATAHVGIRVAGQAPCAQGHVCRRVTLWATQKSIPPYCEHSCYDEAGNYSLANCRRECETWAGCQEPQFVDYVGGGENPGGGIQMLISHPDWGNTWGRLDKQTCAANCPPGMSNPVHNFNGHDKAVDRVGVTRARACMPDGSKCTETTYRTDQ